VQLTRALSLRAIADYGQTRATAALTAIGSGRRATGDVLVTYQVNPFTAVHVGYTAAFDDSGERGNQAYTLWDAFQLPARSSQAFAKVSYGIRCLWHSGPP
jgi:hypothetical protein